MKKYLRPMMVLLFCHFSGVHSQNPGTLKWECEIGSDEKCPAIGDDGTIYIGGDTDFYAINPDGSIKWEYHFTSGSYTYTSPAVGPDGIIYYCRSNTCYAFNTNGTVKWTFNAADKIYSSPAVNSESTIYFGSRDKKIYAINSDGTQKWSYTTGNEVDADPSIGSDGTIYIGCDDNNLYAINPNGSLKWAFPTNWEIDAAPAIDTDGTIYIGCYLYFYAINPDGTQKWDCRVGDDIYDSAAIGPDGTIYVGTDGENELQAMNPDGTVKWTFRTGDNVRSEPAIGSDGIIYFTSWDQYIYALNPNGTLNWKYKFDTGLGSPDSDVTIGSDGTIYFSYYSLFAMNSSSDGLADSPWPKYHQNRRNSGCAEGTVSLIMMDEINFGLVNNNGSFQKEFSVKNLSAKTITLNSCVFGNSLFTLDTSLPMTINSGETKELTLNIRPDETGLYESTCDITYEINGDHETISGNLKAGLFLNDDGELAYIAKKAIDGYNLCYTDDPGSVATQNNLGVLYRLLNQPDLAEQQLSTTVSQALNADYGYTGIKMNLGVVKSDQGLTSEAGEFYDVALADLSSNKDESTLTPQVYYNQAWEAYINGDFAGADTSIAKILSHVMTNDFLKSKAYVLRGAIHFQNGNSDAAADDFNQAILLDPDGPIGRLAQENLDALYTGVGDITAGLPQDFTLMPNSPNPFNPETTVHFGLPKDSDVALTVYNVLGRQVRILKKGITQAGWHTLKWDGLDDFGRRVGTGIYLLMLNAGDFKSVQKMMLVR